MTFHLPAPFGSDIPMEKLHFWQWARAQPRNRVDILTYLSDIGFILGADKLEESQYNTLDIVCDYFHRVAPHLPAPLRLTQAFAPGGEFYVEGLPGRYTPCPAIVDALQSAGWIYDISPETTYFSVSKGKVWAKYQQIIGQRCLCEVIE